MEQLYKLGDMVKIVNDETTSHKVLTVLLHKKELKFTYAYQCETDAGNIFYASDFIKGNYVIIDWDDIGMKDKVYWTAESALIPVYMPLE